MTAKEYLRQAYRLDQRIDSDIEEAKRLREIASSVSTPMLGDRVQTSPSGDARFTRQLDKIMELEEKIDKEINLYVDLKKQVHEVISTVPDTDERLVLRYRYIQNYTWEQIGAELNAESRTVRRWHANALLHVVMPENPIKI